MSPRDRTQFLTADWRKKENDVVYHHPNGPDGHFLYGVFGCKRYSHDGREDPSVVDALKDRGYDITTLKFSIRKDPNHSRWHPPPPPLPSTQPPPQPCRWCGEDLSDPRYASGAWVHGQPECIMGLRKRLNLPDVLPPPA